MLSQDLLRKVSLIELTTRKTVDEMMSGQYRSRFKGHGVTFSEHRLYIPGDDVRHIDWKVSARSRDPVIKKFDEERELTVLLVIDVSGSESFGSAGKVKAEISAEIAAMLAYAAIHTGDKVGVLLFAGEIEKVIPPRKGRKHILRIIEEILTFRPKSRGTNLAGAAESAERLMKHAGVVFVISDFLASGYEKRLKRLARRHDVVSVVIGDEREKEIPEIGQLLLYDPESGEERVVDTGSYAFKKWLKERHEQNEASLAQLFKGGAIEKLRISTREDYGEAVVRFFRVRARRRR